MCVLSYPSITDCLLFDNDLLVYGIFSIKFVGGVLC